ncbi:MAG: molybdopterin-synthase adenylyltransferase MoeB [Rhodospirillales bacterium]|nr:molybdopterin-synthase adenylyltransferase MoeB [Rhodospirillales bacterium]
MEFREEQIQRYARHILLDEVGGDGQKTLLNARVLIIGAGGLGSPLLLYLAAAGVGTIGVVDDDVVDLSNLQRQIVHPTAAVGLPKVESARRTIGAINPDVRVVSHHARLAADNALDLVSAYDIVADGSDNFPTRFLVNDACHFAKRPLVSGAILRFDGQVATFKPFAEPASGEAPGPCYRCLFREPPPAGDIPSCAEAGVLGAFCGVIGSMQATEVIKELLGIGQSLSGWLMVLDALSSTVRKIRVRRDPACPLCGDRPSIVDLSAHGEHDTEACAHAGG